MNYKVNISITTFNRLYSNEKSLPNIIETVSSNIPVMISVIDNGSTDGTKEFLLELFNQKKIHNLLLLPENIGVSKAHNIMWKLYDDIDFYGKVDNDMFFKKNNWLNDIIFVLENEPKIGALGFTCEPKVAKDLVHNGKVKYRKTAGNLGGACFFVPKNVHKKLGFWCENYALYGEEDADYSTRVNVSGHINACMEDLTVMENIPEIYQDYVDFKMSNKKINLSGIWQNNMNEYYINKNLYRDSNQLEIYKDQIMTNI